LAVLYEQLRRSVLDGGWGGRGAVVLQRDGMKSWMETCLRIPQPSVPVCPAHELATTNIPPGGDLVQLIAAMVLEIHQQGAIS
jgi:hypothetical protein